MRLSLFLELRVRTILMRELDELLGSKSKFNVNYRHLNLLIDTMTYRGIMMPIGRHGINRSADNGPLAKASFEEMAEIFVKAGTYAESDNMKGISGNVIMGQFAPIGTNMFDIYLDEEMLAENLPDGDDEFEMDVDPYQLEQEIDEMYLDPTVAEEDVTDEMFNFGLDYDSNNQFDLSTTQLAPPILNVDGKIEKIEKIEAVEENANSNEEIDMSENDTDEEISDSEAEANSDEEISDSEDEEEVKEHEMATKLENAEDEEDEEISDSDDEEISDSEAEEISDSEAEEDVGDEEGDDPEQVIEDDTEAEEEEEISDSDEED